MTTDNQWISIHDRMPDDFKEVLTFNPTGPFQAVAFWDGREWSSGDARADAYDKDDPDGISHWMPLPPPPVSG